MPRLSAVVGALLTCVLLAVPAAGASSTRTDAQSSAGVPSPVAEASAAKRKALPKRRGGNVRRAWPAKKAGRPKRALARWLARQVGPAPKRRTKGRARAAAWSAGQAVPFVGSSGDALALVRSYAIPAGDPSAERLANLSWTYNSAVAAVAFTELGATTQAVQLLDQLAALQRSDGSIDFAFNTRTGQSVPLFRAGTVAWVGLAATAYRAATCSTRYDAVATGAARWLVQRRSANGLLTGGPDVSWQSTQHNLVGRAFLAAVVDAAERKSCRLTVETSLLATIRTTIAGIDAGLDRDLLVRMGSGQASFRQGVADDVRPVDTQALGILWLLRAGRDADAAAVKAYADATMRVSGRSIARSLDAPTFNATYTSAGPFTGYRPYADPAAPDVLWAEGTLEMRFAADRLGADTRTLDASLASWSALSGYAGPLQSDRTVSGNVFNEYHVWPDAAAAAWTLLNATDFSALGS